VAFSPDGKYLSLVENFCGGVDFQVRRIDGSLVSETNGTVGLPLAPTMGVWSGSTLYFRDAKGVEAWRDGTVTPFLPGVAWITPKASPAGGKITYAARGKDGLGHVYVVDTGTGKVVSLPNAGRVEPVFLSPLYIWYAGEQLCSPPGSCMGPGTLPTGKTYIYDLQTGTETESRITAVYDVWPHGS
jgi:DNA-binding beta-propeller fold protein YncE